MKDTNVLVVTGRLTRDAEVKYTSGGMAIGSLSLAVNRSVKKGDGWTEEASFFDVSCFGKTAENLKQYLTKGKQILVRGSIKQDRWEKDGNKMSRVTIDAEEIQLLGGREVQSRQEQSSGYQAPAENYTADNFESDDFENIQF